MFKKNFYDKYWNFNNQDFVKLLTQAKKLKLKRKNKWPKKLNQNISLFNSVSKKELWEFLSKLSIFTNSWIDIKWALTILSKQIKNPYMKDICVEIRDNIDHWITISETMWNYPKVFDNLTVALISVWEKTGQLWRILAELDKNLLETIELKWKVKWAMIYPMVLLWLTFVMVIGMMTFIVPRVTATFTKTWVALPKLTQYIVNVSDFFKEDYLILIWIIVTLVVTKKLIAKTSSWKMFFANTMTKLPIFWYVVIQSNIIYFIRSFTLLLDSWVLLLEALRTSSQVVTNLAYKKEIIRIKNEVEVWLTISKSLWLNTEYEESVYLNKLFPEEFAYVVSTWEETWSLSDSLKKVWVNYNSELKRFIWNMSSMLEPLIIIVVWALVGTIIIGIMLPFFAMGEVAKKM